MKRYAILCDTYVQKDREWFIKESLSVFYERCVLEEIFLWKYFRKYRKIKLISAKVWYNV
ncbi:hypothetical protein EMIT079MI2_70073 [Bacillus sp. IT-79MI2]